ncbi:SgcJ/EcaC family oxidoreductase [Paenibacillus lautus]|uniref:SgcJ/EcaC family oxidoreductase n=1 Tax=Paenibacillus lautus TaxID=1401 RepID=UPI003D2E7DD4
MSNIQENHKGLEEQEGRIIRQTISVMESAFNRHDADALDRHFTQDSTWVNVMGEMLSGWEQINNAHKVVLTGPLLHSYAKYFVEKLVFLRRMWPSRIYDSIRLHRRGNSSKTDKEAWQSM